MPSLFEPVHKVFYIVEKLKMQIIEDDFGKSYKVNDLKRFKKHLEEYHSFRGKGDNSVHEENGYWFTVTATFYDQIMALEV